MGLSYNSVALGGGNEIVRAADSMTPTNDWRSMREPRPGETPWEIITEVEPVEEPVSAMTEPADEPRRIVLPLALFLLTCASTYWVAWADSHSVKYSLMYSGAVIFILTAHEMGHYVQTRRYGVPASLPYFIPMPASIIGTMGAVIAMRGHMGDRKSLYDIGISGPLAGLVPALIFSAIGLSLSTPAPMSAIKGETSLGVPLIFRLMISHYFGELPPNTGVDLHPFAFAGWVGVLITSLNLVPIGQLDGGHILYALLREKAWAVATFLLLFAIGWTILTRNPTFTIMLFLLALIGPNHPPTADDNVPLGFGRIVLGWLTLGFILLGFTPRPLQF
jgi:membrane-associated protease RseP (regulator of RpoE activity)